MALAMVLGGLRAAEVRSMRLADVDRGLRRVRLVGKGNRERTVPTDRAFFTKLGNYLRTERPSGCATPEVLRRAAGPDPGRTVDRSGDAAHLPHPSGQLGFKPSASSSFASYLWDRARHRRLTDADFDAFTAAVEATPLAARDTRSHNHARAFSLQSGLLRGADICSRTPRKNGRPAATLVETLNALPQPEIRRVALRYLEGVATTLR